MAFIKKSKMLIILLFLLFPFIVLNINGEKWVGQAATYQLIEGKKTANGDFFDKDSLTVACNGFKLGAEIKVINPKNGKEIAVIVSDRINVRSDYFILLTPRVAKELEFEWETGLIVVEANFSDINSTERLAINGLVREGEIDVETLKKFPEINWPEDEKIITDKTTTVQEENGYPVEEEKEIPEKETKLAKIDTDEKNGDVKEEDQFETMPEQEKEVSPEQKMKKYILSEDVDEKTEEKKEDVVKEESQFPEKEDKIVMVKPEAKKEKSEIDQDTKDQSIKEKEETIKEIPEVKPIWVKKLEKGKIYIRFSTALDKTEGDRRYILFKKIFKNVIGVEKGSKYILYLGPITEDKIDTALDNIRRFGFRDAYISKE